MAKVLPHIDADLAAWMLTQRMFFVGTSPLAAEGHVNISPKGGDAFRVLGEREVAWCDYTGSGIETTAHLQENGRLVVMFCAFAGPPRIVRLHGRGTVHLPGSPRFVELIGRFPPSAGTRVVITQAVTRVATSCGFGVPFYDYQGERDTLERWAQTKGPEGVAAYRAEKNRRSIDGLPGLG